MAESLPSVSLSKPLDKIVVAMFDFESTEANDLKLTKGEEYEVISDIKEYWWEVRDKSGATGFIPSNYVQEKTSLGLHKFDWFMPKTSRQECERLLKSDGKEGCFLVRNSSSKGMYTLSVVTRFLLPYVKHYHIKRNAREEYYLSKEHSYPKLEQLINYHKSNGTGIITRLGKTPTKPQPQIPDKTWKIDASEFTFDEASELGRGQFAVVRKGKWRGSVDVAVKIMNNRATFERGYITKGKIMTKLQHQNVVLVYGVCSTHYYSPIYIITEYMMQGSLLNYLRQHEKRFAHKPGDLLDMAVQVCRGMAYLEKYNCIHRDLAARNCLVGAENVIKVADFGIAGYTYYKDCISRGFRCTIKWSPPEVCRLSWHAECSSKSDVWAYGVLMWEIFTCGKEPYGKADDWEVLEKVHKGERLDKPACPDDVYTIMKTCWEQLPDNRPSFYELQGRLEQIGELHWDKLMHHCASQSET